MTIKKIIHVVCLLFLVSQLLNCRKKHEPPVVSDTKTVDTVTTVKPPPGTNGGGTLTIDPKQVYGKLVYTDLTITFPYGSFEANSSAVFSNNLTDVSAGLLNGTYAGSVIVRGYSLVFKNGSYQSPIPGWLDTGPITWFIGGSNELPSFTYTTPESFFGFSRVLLPDTIRKGVAFNFTVTNVVAHAASLSINVVPKPIMRTLKNGDNIINIGSDEAALLSGTSAVLMVNLTDQYLVSSGEKKIVMERKKEYTGSIRTTY